MREYYERLCTLGLCCARNIGRVERDGLERSIAEAETDRRLIPASYPPHFFFLQSQNLSRIVSRPSQES
jgi:hypothetical protein